MLNYVMHSESVPMKRLRVWVAALTVCLVTTADAGNRSGTVTAQFLKLPVDARSTAMGNAFVSLANGATSIGYNPAGILSISNVGFGGTYNSWFADITHSFFAVAANLGEDLGSIGVGVTVLSTDEMKVTTPQFPEGTGEVFKATDFAYTVTYARQISEMFGLGLSAKYITSNLYNTDINANSIAFDIGTLYDIPVLRTRLGISLLNLGRDLKFINEQYSLPTSLRFGARTSVYEDDMHRAYIALQVGRPNDADEQYNVGAEYVFSNLLALRGGYRFNYDTEDWSGGVGFDLGSIHLDGRLDYSYTHFKFLPGTHMFTIEIGF
jgi:hypothetical protein